MKFSKQLFSRYLHTFACFITILYLNSEVKVIFFKLKSYFPVKHRLPGQDSGADVMKLYFSAMDRAGSYH